MTMGACAAYAVRDRLAARDLRRTLTAMLQHRLPAEDVEDVAQTVLCDALAAGSIPADPVEMRRWLAGIARHKVADFHRTRARRAGRTDAFDDADDDADIACPPPPVEARALLASVVEETRAPRDRETLSWLVREHAGDRLADIAKEAGLPSPVVRQRVSRLRRALRARWASALVVLVVGGGLVAAAANMAPPEKEAIAPDPSIVAPRVAPAAQPASPLDGTWTVESVDPKATLTPAEKKLLEKEASSVKVHVDGRRIDLAIRGGHLALTVTDVARIDDRTSRITLVADSGASVRATVTADGADRLRVSIPQGRLAGRAVLRRAAER